MGYKLCIAEKPSVGRDIARVLGACGKGSGYLYNDEYIVTWALGHLVGLAEPEAYGYVPQGDMYSKDREVRKEARAKALAELPLMPDEFKLTVLESTKDQFNVIKGLLHRDDVDEVINCGDMGPEGHVLQWLIREKAGCDKPVRRFCATSMTDEAIRYAFGHLRPEEEFADIVKGELAKKKADWMLGMSLSRCATVEYNKHITVGRVQSPTLYFVVKRYLEAANFKVTDYYGLEAVLEEGFSVFWNRDTENVFAPELKDGEGRLLDGDAARNMAKGIKNEGAGTVTSVEKTKRGKNPPQLYDITELERDADRKYGYSAALTLAAAQALYETQKVLTYPRTDSRYITEDLFPYMEGRIRAIGRINENFGEAVDMLLADTLKATKRTVDDAKVTDHHAIVPTERIAGFDPDAMAPTDGERKNGVTEDVMKNVLNLVLVRTVTAFAPMYTYEQTAVAVKLRDITFTASGTRPLEQGYKAIEERMAGKEEKEADAEADPGQTFPELSEGQTVHVEDCRAKPKKTAPPKLHTEATLLTAMENAGAGVTGGAVLKGKGIGTQATRAGIIKKLFEYGYCEKRKKSIVPTMVGLNLIKMLPQELYSPKMTADWETLIAEIAEGKLDPEEFLDDFKKFLREETEKIKAADKDISFYGEPNDGLKCPWCGKPLRRWEGRKENNIRYFCGDNSCHFALNNNDERVKDRLGRNLKESELIGLIEKGSIDIKHRREGKARETLLKLYRKEKGDGRVFANIDMKFIK